MTNVGRVRETILRNTHGIMEPTMCFQTQHIVKSNTRMYFYRFDFYDLVEVSYDDNHIVIYDFPHSGDNAKVIEDDKERFAGYFNSAGLKGKRFLFDVSTKMPVSYYDFIEVKKIPKIILDSDAEFAFILDKKNEVYITTPKDVKIYVAHETSKTIDKIVLSLFNDSIGITKSSKNHLKKNATFFSFFLSGMLNGIRKDDIKDGIDGVDLNNKLFYSLSGMEFNSDYVKNRISGLKTDKFISITKKETNDKEEPTPVGDAIKKFTDRFFLQDIIEQGLDQFVKRHIKDGGKSHTVVIDFEWQSIKSAYIRDGILYITPTQIKPISYFTELVSSDNVQYILQ